MFCMEDRDPIDCLASPFGANAAPFEPPPKNKYANVRQAAITPGSPLVRSEPERQNPQSSGDSRGGPSSATTTATGLTTQEPMPLDLDPVLANLPDLFQGLDVPSLDELLGDFTAVNADARHASALLQQLQLYHLQQQQRAAVASMQRSASLPAQIAGGHSALSREQIAALVHALAARRQSTTAAQVQQQQQVRNTESARPKIPVAPSSLATTLRAAKSMDHATCGLGTNSPRAVVKKIAKAQPAASTAIKLKLKRDSGPSRTSSDTLDARNCATLSFSTRGASASLPAPLPEGFHLNGGNAAGVPAAAPATSSPFADVSTELHQENSTMLIRNPFLDISCPPPP